MVDPTRDPRMAGDVDRYHTWPTLRRQSIAEHSWNVARLVLVMWPEADPRMLTEALFHDTGEAKTGDLPFPIKRENPALKKEMDRLEDSARQSMVLTWMMPAPKAMHENARRVLKLADMLEMWEFGMQEVMLGNRMAHPIINKTWGWISGEILEMQASSDVWLNTVGNRAKDYASKRSKEWGV